MHHLNDPEYCTCDTQEEERLCPYDLEIKEERNYCTCCPECRSLCAGDI